MNFAIRNELQALNTNQNYSFELKEEVRDPAIGNDTQPYWLQKPQTAGNFIISNPLLVGKAWNDASANVQYLKDVMERYGLGERWAYRDIASGNGIDIVTITKDGVKKVFTQELSVKIEA